MPLDRDEHDHKCVECKREWICLRSAWVVSEKCANEKTGLCDDCFAKLAPHPDAPKPGVDTELAGPHLRGFVHASKRHGEAFA